MQTIKQLCNGPVQGNTYVIGQLGECYIIDPGYDYNLIIQYVESHYHKVKAILLTHGHFDHCGAVDEVAEHFCCQTYMDLQDMMFIATPDKPLSNQLFGMQLTLKTPITDIQQFHDENVLVLPTPGHSKGSVSFVFKDSKALFSGDCVFEYDIGRVDLPGGDFKEMLESLKLIATLPDDYTVYPGHEGIGNLGQMKHGLNPYLSRAD